MDISTLSKQKKSIIKVVFIVLGILAIGGIVSLFMLNYNTFLPTAPSIVNDGNKTIITTNANENYQKYRFRFNLKNEKEIIIESETNVLSQEDIEKSELEVGSTYSVSVCYVAKDEKETTDYSESTSWTYIKNLIAPTISIDEEQKLISWEAVENAESYEIYYRTGEDAYKIKTADTSFSYSNLGGETILYVVATSSNAGYKDSISSNALTFENKTQLSKIAEAQFKIADYSLTVKSVEELSYLKVYINNVGHVAKLSAPTMNNGKYSYTINIVTIYEDGAKIGVAAYSQNENFIESDILYL